MLSTPVYTSQDTMHLASVDEISAHSDSGADYSNEDDTAAEGFNINFLDLNEASQGLTDNACGFADAGGYDLGSIFDKKSEQIIALTREITAYKTAYNRVCNELAETTMCLNNYLARWRKASINYDAFKKVHRQTQESLRRERQNADIRGRRMAEIMQSYMAATSKLAELSEASHLPKVKNREIEESLQRPSLHEEQHRYQQEMERMVSRLHPAELKARDYERELAVLKARGYERELAVLRQNELLKAQMRRLI